MHAHTGHMHDAHTAYTRGTHAEIRCHQVSGEVFPAAENFTAAQTLEYTFEPPHDKTNKMTVRPAKTQISLGIRPV